MKKISKEDIINTTIEIIKDSNGLQNINLRKIAKKLGCAHTNIYNYFPSYTDLLWEVHSELNRKIVNHIINEVQLLKNPLDKIQCFFKSITDMYMDNTEWFRFIWLYHIGDKRPENHVSSTNGIVEELVSHIFEIVKLSVNDKISHQDVFYALHNTHCYMIGEITNFISKRRIIENEIELKEYLIKQSLKIFTFYLKEE